MIKADPAAFTFPSPKVPNMCLCVRTVDNARRNSTFPSVSSKQGSFLSLVLREEATEPNVPLVFQDAVRKPAGGT